MPGFRFNHMELTVPKGVLEQHRDEIKDFYGDVFGFDALVVAGTTTRAFYVRFLLPIWFDVQVIEFSAEAQPERQWRFGASIEA